MRKKSLFLEIADTGIFLWILAYVFCWMLTSLIGIAFLLWIAAFILWNCIIIWVAHTCDLPLDNMPEQELYASAVLSFVSVCVLFVAAWFYKPDKDTDV